jgi:hypothetical protein
VSTRNPRPAERPGHAYRRSAPGAPIRADVRLTNNKGFTRRFSSWENVAAWLTSNSFLGGSSAVTSIRLVHIAAQADTAKRAAAAPGPEGQ